MTKKVQNPETDILIESKGKVESFFDKYGSKLMWALVAITIIAVGIFILILQQFDGNILGPKILGDSVDLSPLWIILAVVIGGALMGPLGMFIGVPIFATVKVFGGEYIDRMYWNKDRSKNPLNLSKKGTDEDDE